MEPGKCYSALTTPSLGHNTSQVGVQHSSSLPLCRYVYYPFDATQTEPGAWLVLPSPFRWLIRTIRLSYMTQFTRFSGTLFILGQTMVPLSCVDIVVLLAKDIIEPVPPAEMKVVNILCL